MENSVDDAKCNPEVIGGAYFMGSFMAVTGIMATILVLSGVFHSALRRLSQPSIISYILAGIMVGPTALGRTMDLRQLGMKDAGSAMSSTIYYIRILFMFFIGLELDLVYVRRNLRRSVAVACSSTALCFVLSFVGRSFFSGLLFPPDQAIQEYKIFASEALVTVVLTSTASPVLIRVVTELKLAGSETGQLAIGAAIATDMVSLAALSLMSVSYTAYGPSPTSQRPPPSMAAKAYVMARIAVAVWAATFVTARAARLLNRRKRGRRYVSKYELCGVLVLVAGLSVAQRSVGYSPSMTAFLIGLNMPREGPTARTIRDRLAFPIHEVMMPLCFAVVGARLDFSEMTAAGGRFTAVEFAAAVVFTTLVSTAGKVLGTVLAGSFLGVTAGEAVMLGVLLNVKGYSDVLAINLGNRIGVWAEYAQAVLLVSSVISTFMVGPASATIARWQQRRSVRYRSRCLQDDVVLGLGPDRELRALVCVHGAVDVHPLLTLADLSRATAPLTTHLLHLVELVPSRKYAITNQLYHAGRNTGDDDDEWGYARDVDRVASAVACFTYDHAPAVVRQSTAVSSIASMDEDVRNGADDARASLVVVPFHKELRYDGRMVCRREGRRQINRRILERTPCTVGIFVERRLFDVAATPAVDGDAQARRERPAVVRVAAVFLGGPDDREAVAYAARMAAHPSASVTLCRFLPAPGCCPAVEEAAGEEAMADERFMTSVHERLVAPGKMTYTERYVSNGAETVTALSAMARDFALFVVGRTSRGAAAEAMTSGMGDWDDECPELGPVGELLASDDVVGGGSVLVLRMHGDQPRNRMRTWKDDPSAHAASSSDALVVDIYKDPPPGLFTANLNLTDRN